MNNLTASRLLAIWELGAGMLPVQRALTLLTTAFPEESPGDLADLSIGQRDYRLLKLREQTFGPRFTCLADCPACSEQVEMNFQVSDIPLEASVMSAREGLTADLEGYQLRFRLPTSRDFQMVANHRTTGDDPAVDSLSGDRPGGARKLMEQCILEAMYAGKAVGTDELPPAMIEVMSAQIIQADPFAELWIALTCPACRHTWRALFDIVSYFWSEIDAWAYRTLQEVHLLAKSYGWHEAEILDLSAWRRQYYLSLL